MAIVNLTSLDFDQIKSSLRDYLRANSNFTDYDFEGSNFSTLIDVLAYNTYISSYNTNMVSNEVFLDSATLRENIVSRAKEIGYTPRSRTAARANITISVDTTSLSTNPVTLTLKQGAVATTNAYNGVSYTFSILEDITVPVINGVATFDQITVYEGSYTVQNYVLADDYTRLLLDNEGIDTSLIKVRVNNTSNTSQVQEQYNLSTNIFGVNDKSKVFFIQEVEDERYEVYFGDNIFGQRPASNSTIEISYLLCNGKDANGVFSFTFTGRFFDNNGRIVNSDISAITTNTAAFGGKDIESINSIKKYAPLIYSTQHRAVTPSDYEAIIPQIYPEAESVAAFGGETLTPPRYGKVYISIKPINGPFVSNTVKDNIKTELRKYSVGGIVPEIIDLKYLYVQYDSTVYYNANYSTAPDTLKTIINNNILNYSNSSDLNRYGARFKYSKFLKLIDDSDAAITSNITKISMRRELRVETNKFASYEICFGNSFHVSKETGYNIKSSAFNIAGSSFNVYISDLPVDKEHGNLFIFRLDGTQQPIIIKNNVGTINYLKGEILINPINITNTSKSVGFDKIIQFSAIPKSNDIIGLQDLYLQVDVNSSVVNMLTDTISSGYDISGVNYVSTSSYLNGDLVLK
jgi:hypothetical protein